MNQQILDATAETWKEAAALTRTHRAGVLALVPPSNEVAIALWQLARAMDDRADQIPVLRRLIVLWSCVVAWAWLLWYGSRRIDVYGNKRLGRVCAVLGFGVLVFGLGLWCSTEYRWSWGWWL